MGEYISEIIKQWKEESKTRGVIQFNYSCFTNILTIYSAYPGYLIGKSGCYINKYTEILRNLFHDLKSIEFVETDYYYVD